MSIDADSDADAVADDADEVDELARELGEAVADLPVYREFAEAKAAVEEDPELQEAIGAFQQKRREFALARQSGEATQEDVRDLQEAQQDLHARPKMAEYLDAQERLQDRLEDINEAISGPLAVDFGGEAGGCCQD